MRHVFGWLSRLRKPRASHSGSRAGRPGKTAAELALEDALADNARQYTGHHGPGNNCDRPPTHRGIWRFEALGPQQILLCDKHAAVLAGRERLTNVEPLGG